MNGTEAPQRPATPFAYPPAPMNGGRLGNDTPAKVGEWGWEPKVDDWRGVVHAPTRTVWNQYGQPSALANREKFEEALTKLQFQAASAHLEWFDVGMMEARNDMMRGTIIVLDVIMGGTTLASRRCLLARMFAQLPLDVAAALEAAGGQMDNGLWLINQWREVTAPLLLQDYLLIQNKQIGRKFFEGLVAKNLDSTYPLAQSAKVVTPAWIKHRFDQP